MDGRSQGELSRTMTGYYIKIYYFEIRMNMKLLYVYILECSDTTFYIGITNDVGRRFIEHSTGLHEESYTYKRRPLKLVYCKQFKNPMDAINYEKQLKRWSRAKKEALIAANIDLLHELSKCKNATSHLNFNRTVLSKSE